ncbi:MAG: GNAT family N-acetyltransferase [Clostridia bacterium]|nr:GNAT family N-acetyltransferase [Clostridia bacterium]
MNFREPKGIIDYFRILRLYRKAFPISERKPFSAILKMKKAGKADIWYFEDERGFLGFSSTINGEREILIDYFAVSDKRRGQGHGTRMLTALLNHYEPLGVFLEIEIPYESAENYTERVRRKNFYIAAGMTPMNTYAKLFGVDMELMGKRCALDYDEYREFYLKNYGRFAYDHIEKVEL